MIRKLREMLKNLIRKTKNLLFAIPFGMKAGDELLATSSKDDNVGSSIHKKVEQNSLLEALLRGEVTQEVEELRYETYKAEEESNNYAYVGNGQSVKIDDTEKKKANRRLKFIQLNGDIEYGLSESLKIVEDASDDYDKMDFKTKKIFNITYDNPFVKFKLENYVEKIEVNLKNGVRTTFYFVDNKTHRKIVPLINALKKANNDLSSFDADDYEMIKAYVSRNEILSSMKELSFTTLNPTNNVPSGISYKFINPTFDGIKEKDDVVMLSFTWEKYEGGKLLSEIYHSESAEKKFKEKAKRENYDPTLTLQF